MTMSNWQGWLYVAAVLIPLAAFVVELLLIRVLKRLNAYLATLAIASSFVLSVIGLASMVPSLLAGHEAETAQIGKVEGSKVEGRRGSPPQGTSGPAPTPPPRPRPPITPRPWPGPAGSTGSP